MSPRILDLLDRIQPHLRHIPDVTHTEIEELRAVLCSDSEHECAARKVAEEFFRLTTWLKVRLEHGDLSVLSDKAFVDLFDKCFAHYRALTAQANVVESAQNASNEPSASDAVPDRGTQPKSPIQAQQRAGKPIA